MDHQTDSFKSFDHFVQCSAKKATFRKSKMFVFFSTPDRKFESFAHINFSHLKMLAKNDYYLETKMDGERCQVHVDGTQFKYFSRGGKDDFTQTFGSSNVNGTFSPFFHRQLSAEVKNAIFDGEMMVWDNVDDTFLKKCEFIFFAKIRSIEFLV